MIRLSELSPCSRGSLSACWWGRWRWRQLIESSPSTNYYWEITKPLRANRSENINKNRWQQKIFRTHMGMRYVYIDVQDRPLKLNPVQKLAPAATNAEFFKNLSQTCLTTLSPWRYRSLVIVFFFAYAHPPKFCATDRQFGSLANGLIWQAAEHRQQFFCFCYLFIVYCFFPHSIIYMWDSTCVGTRMTAFGVLNLSSINCKNRLARKGNWRCN